MQVWKYVFFKYSASATFLLLLFNTPATAVKEEGSIWLIVPEGHGLSQQGRQWESQECNWSYFHLRTEDGKKEERGEEKRRGEERKAEVKRERKGEWKKRE